MINSDKNFLKDIIGFIAITHIPVNIIDQMVFIPADQESKGGIIAILKLTYQLFIGFLVNSRRSFRHFYTS